MIVVRGTAATPAEQRSSTFTGEVWAEPLVPGVDGVTVATIFFAPCARTYWHRHERGQLLVITGGEGLVCADGEQPEALRAGDVVWIAPGERHWHGGTADHFMTHTAISLGTTQWDVEVAEAEYAAATQTRGNHR
ncbi:MAG TPA: cupin domain-containing protein [Trebonia sp.]|jgi:quercetin dioxygenase-like cupin family protein|nr:cupin domain-containing protein [Trebonia sp.]